MVQSTMINEIKIEQNEKEPNEGSQANGEVRKNLFSSGISKF